VSYPSVRQLVVVRRDSLRAELISVEERVDDTLVELEGFRDVDGAEVMEVVLCKQ